MMATGKDCSKCSKAVGLHIPKSVKSLLVQSLKSCQLIDEARTLLTPFQFDIRQFADTLKHLPQTDASIIGRSVTRTNIQTDSFLRSFVTSCEMHSITSNSISALMSTIFTGTKVYSCDFFITLMFYLSDNRVAYCCPNYFEDCTKQKITKYTLSMWSDLLNVKIFHGQYDYCQNFFNVNIYIPYCAPQLDMKPIYLASVYKSKKVVGHSVLYSDTKIVYGNSSVFVETGKKMSESLTVHDRNYGISFDNFLLNFNNSENATQNILEEHQTYISAMLKSLRLMMHQKYARKRPIRFKLPIRADMDKIFIPVARISFDTDPSRFFCRILLGDSDIVYHKIINVILRACKDKVIMSSCRTGQFINDIACIIKYFNIPVNVYTINDSNEVYLKQMDANECWKANRSYLLKRQIHLLMDNNGVTALQPLIDESALSIFYNKLKSVTVIHDPSRGEIGSWTKEETLHLIYSSFQNVASRNFDLSTLLTSFKIGHAMNLFRNIEIDIVQNDNKMTVELAKKIFQRHFSQDQEILSQLTCALQSTQIRANVYSIPHDKHINIDFITILCKLGIEDMFLSVNYTKNDSLYSLICNLLGLDSSNMHVLRVLVLFEFLRNYDKYTCLLLATEFYTRLITKVDILYHVIRLFHTPEEQEFFECRLPIFFILSSILQCEIVCLYTDETCKIRYESYNTHSKEEKTIYILSILNNYHLLIEKKPKNQTITLQPMQYHLLKNKPAPLNCSLLTCCCMLHNTHPTMTHDKNNSKMSANDENDEVAVHKKTLMDGLGLLYNKEVRDEDKEGYDERVSELRFGMVANRSDHEGIIKHDGEANMDESNIIFENDEPSSVLLESCSDLESIEVQSCLTLSTEQKTQHQPPFNSTSDTISIPSPELVLVNQKRVDDKVLKKSSDNKFQRWQGKKSTIIMCYDCHIEFGTSEKLYEHFEEVHFGVIPRCMYCPTYFSSLKLRSIHMKREHIAELQKLQR